MKNKQINSLLLDAIEEYGIDKLTEVLKTLENQKAKETAKLADAVDLYKQIILFTTTYYPDHMSEEEGDALARALDSNPQMALEVIENALEINEKTFEECNAKAKAQDKDKGNLKVTTNINGDVKTYTVDMDKYLDIIEEFFDKYGI